MASRHTFHTPSFGDEEFELPQLHHNSLLIGGDSHTYDMSTISASDSTSISNYSHPQWPASHQTDHIKSDSVTLTGNEFLVLRSPPQHEANVSGGTAMADQTISSDESDDNGMKPDAKHDNRLKHKRDPNAPQKPPAAYALFFRDTQAAIKGQNPSASFDEVSTIVASMWDVLDPEHKNVYKKKAEDAKREYRKSLSAYRANVVAKSEELPPPRVEKPPAANHSPVTQPIPIANTTPMASNYNSLSQQVPISAPVQPAHNVDGVAEHPIDPAIVSEQMCVRNGCPNQAIVSIDWEDEYCSNECVITHCRDIFSRWVQDISAAPESYQAT